ncbi:MAG: hypothetical protein IJS84_09820 [Spirochaetales bacterium]|nr:hypothetical protein [Spirochaetales bacterium]
MSKKLTLMIVVLALCLVFAQSAFAEEKTYPDEYRMFEVRGEAENFYSLEEALWFNPTVYSVEVLEFLQAYLQPEDPVSFFLDAATYTDEDIDENAVIFQSFIEPDYAGAMPYLYRCDLEALTENLGYDLFDPEGRYEFSFYFEEPGDFAALFPRGIGRANAYDTFRRCALSLAFYAKAHGEAPGFKVAYDYIQQAFAYFEQQFLAAMEAEAQATAENGTVVQEGPEN